MEVGADELLGVVLGFISGKLEDGKPSKIKRLKTVDKPSYSKS